MHKGKFVQKIGQKYGFQEIYNGGIIKVNSILKVL